MSQIDQIGNLSRSGRSLGVYGVFEGALNRLFIVFKHAPNRLFVSEREGSLKGCIVLGEINKTAVP